MGWGKSRVTGAKGTVSAKLKIRGEPSPGQKAATRAHNFCRRRRNSYLKNPYSREAFNRFKTAYNELARINPADANRMLTKVRAKMHELGISEKDLQ